MESVSKAITNTVAISQFNKGMAGQIFAEVKKDGAKVVMKNNVAEAVIMSPDDYLEITDALNDYELYVAAVERMNKYDPSKIISDEELLASSGITDADIAHCEVEIE